MVIFELLYIIYIPINTYKIVKNANLKLNLDFVLNEIYKNMKKTLKLINICANGPPIEIAYIIHI